MRAYVTRYDIAQIVATTARSLGYNVSIQPETGNADCLIGWQVRWA